MPSDTLDYQKFRLSVALILVALVVLAAWQGNVDSQSSDYLESSMIGAGAIFATARGINAVVSVLQGTELDLPFLTIAVGEVLDPINDLIERFSGIVMIALASFGIQLLLINIMHHSIFNIFLTAMGAGTVIAALWGDHNHYHVWLRLFLISIIVRFSLVLTVLLGSLVDSVFLYDSEQRNHEAMIVFYQTTTAASAAIETGDKLKSGLETAREDLTQSEALLVKERESLLQTKSELKQERNILKSIDRSPIWDFNPFRRESEEVRQQRELVYELVQKEQRSEYTIAQVGASIPLQAENVECLEKQARGKACSWWDRAKDKFGEVRDTLNVSKKAEYVKKQMQVIEDGIDDFARNTIYLLASTLLKSILIPIGFLFLIYRLSRSALRRTFH